MIINFNILILQFNIFYTFFKRIIYILKTNLIFDIFHFQIYIKKNKQIKGILKCHFWKIKLDYELKHNIVINFY